MARLRSNNVFGTTTNAPLTAGGTTLNSAGLANLAAVSGSDTAVITLDPNRVNGAPEIVIVTAHTGSATSATITRAAFGTSAREHAAGTEWVHAAIGDTDSTSMADDADDRGDYLPTGAWEAWTPTWTNLTVGSGTVVARFTRIGRTIHFYLLFTFGSGSAMGDARFTLPVAANAAWTALSPLGRTHILDAGTADFFGQSWLHDADECRVFVDAASSTYVQPTALSSTVPMTWATGDMLWVTGTYEAAS